MSAEIKFIFLIFFFNSINQVRVQWFSLFKNNMLDRYYIKAAFLYDFMYMLNKLMTFINNYRLFQILWRGL